MKIPSAVSKIILASALLAAVPLHAALAASAAAGDKAKPSATAESHSAKEKAATELRNRRAALMKEAVAAEQEVLHTLDHLKKSNRDAAFKSLADASGKLDVVLARAPDLKLAPIDVRTSLIDLSATPDEVKRMITQAKSELGAGHVQAARTLLNPLVSEIQVSTDYLPMETYPAAIKRAVPKIQKGDLKGAEHDLYEALSTIVTTVDVLPIPALKAEADVLEAEQLIKKDKAKNREQALSLLGKANQQLEVGNLLGYGEYKDIKSEIGTVQGKIKGNASDSSLFEKLKHLLQEVRSKV